VPVSDFSAALDAAVAKSFAGPEPSSRDIERFVGSLHVADLALACACMAGREDAHIDADAAAQSREPKLLAEGEYPGSVPPNYIKTYDEGRPRH